MESSERLTKFADILLPVPIPRLFTYRVPTLLESELQHLKRVIVPFGPKKILTGLILNIHELPPADYEAKSLLEILDTEPLFTNQQINLFKWMAEYYMCTEGEVLNAAMPSGLKLSSESLIQINPDFNYEEPAFAFSEKEWVILNRVRYETVSYSDLAKFLQVKSLHSILKSLRLKDAIVIIEEIRENYKPKKEKRIRFGSEFLSNTALEKVFQEIGTKPKQEAILLTLLKHLPIFQEPSINNKGIAKSLLIHESDTTSALKTLLKKGIIEEFEVTVPRFPEMKEESEAIPVLSTFQKEAREKILEHFNTNKPVLLHGVTGSGKTEIYISLIQDAIEAGGQALFLLPEIALTTQMVRRLLRVFGNKLGIYHSKFSDNERVEVWTKVANGEVRVVIGVRSSIFLPFENLSLIVVDEEHDGSYKQDRTPRYQARDTALMLARLHQAKIILGSGTPSVESWYLAKNENFGLVELTQRFGNAQLPKIDTIHLGLEKKLKRLKGSFSRPMLEAIQSTLEQNQQIILFQNRRGYAPCIECSDCGSTPQCMNCSVSLTYHQFKNALICHYCGYKEKIPQACASCGSKSLLSPGPGTEKLEEEVKLYFPSATVNRMDLDTTRGKYSHENILNDFESGKTQILVGTQMVSKGLDFNKVGLVGVFDADRLMHFPDFRSQERAFQTITQVSGRTGRRDQKGFVLIQTFDPENRLFNYLKNHKVADFLDTQLDDRRKTFYPPYSRLIEISFRHPDKRTSLEGAQAFAQSLGKSMPTLTTLGPAEPPIGKIRNEFIQTLLLKIPRSQGKLQEIKSKLIRIGEVLTADQKMKRLRIIYDVDPI